MPDKNWRRGTEKHLSTFASDNNNHDGDSVLLKKEMSQDEYCRLFTDDQDLKLVSTIDISQISQGRQKRAQGVAA